MISFASLYTLRDAANYITELPSVEAEVPEWPAAAAERRPECLGARAPQGSGPGLGDPPFRTRLAFRSFAPGFARHIAVIDRRSRVRSARSARIRIGAAANSSGTNERHRPADAAPFHVKANL
jgi:hypothetical protein